MRIATTILVSVICLSIAGCLPDTSGVDPPSEQLIYPVGLALTASDRYLLVANSNFDLKYNAGTLVAIDLEKLDKIEKKIQANPDKNDYLSEDKKFLFIPEDELIDGAETIEMGSFASDLELTPSGNRAMIPVRGERAVLIVDIDESGSGKLLDCGSDSEHSCDSKHRVESNENHSMPIEPFEVSTLDYGDVTLGFATHLAGGEVSLFRIEEDGKLAPKLLSVIEGVVPGASGIAVNTENNEIYVSGRHDPTPHVAVIKVLSDSENGSYVNNPYFDDVGSINISRDMYAGTDARGIAVSESGETALLVTRLPEALLRIDTSSRELVDMTTLGADPSIVSIYEDNGGNLDPMDDVMLAFVLCFLSDQVYIVDPELMQVHVRTTGFGPHAVAFDKTRQRAYVANFRESTITIIDTKWPYNHVGILVTDPDDPKNKQTAKLKIGKPRLPKDHS